MTESTGVIHRRSAVDGAEAETLEADKTRPRSVAMVKVGGREYPYFSEPGCKTCQSPHRGEIENGIALGYSAATVAASLPESANLGVRNISDHCAKHIPGLREIIARTIVEERAKELGRNLEDTTGTLVDHVAYARVGLQKAFEAMVEGDEKPTIENGIAFANFLLKVEQLGGGADALDREIMFQGFVAYTKAIQKHTTPEQFREISDAITSDPVMVALRQKALEAQSVEDGE